jgi:hypothetical protein
VAEGVVVVEQVAAAGKRRKRERGKRRQRLLHLTRGRKDNKRIDVVRQ